MGRTARAGVMCLMAMAIGLARLVEVELDPGAAPAAAMGAPAARIEESPGPSGGAGGGAVGGGPAAGGGAVGGGPAGGPARPAPAPASPAAATSPEGGRVHVVAAGETLGTIARKVYGSSRHWKTILDANKDVLSSPETMRPGLRLRIPAGPASPSSRR